MKKKDAYELDKTDLAILSYLQKDGRISFAFIAKTLGVSVNTIKSRYERMAQNGNINIVGRINPENIGFAIHAHVAFFVSPASLNDKVAKEISKMPEVSFLAATSGDYNMEVNIICRDNDHLKSFINSLTKIEGINLPETTTYLKVYKFAHSDLGLLK